MRRLKTTQVKAVRLDMLQDQGNRCSICQTLISVDQAVLDHDHSSGFIRSVLCRNCNGIEGKIKNLARRGQRQYDPNWFLRRILAYWEKHDGVTPDHGLIHPTHKTEREKKDRINKRARERRAAKKQG